MLRLPRWASRQRPAQDQQVRDAAAISLVTGMEPTSALQVVALYIDGREILTMLDDDGFGSGSRR